MEAGVSTFAHEETDNQNVYRDHDYIDTRKRKHEDHPYYKHYRIKELQQSQVKMAKFTDLPEEVIIIIVGKLDLPSTHSLYNACKQTRRIVQLPGVVKIFNMSLNKMATVCSFNLNFFKDIVYYLQELNMSGVPDVKKTILILVIKKFKQLKTLDVSYTKITIIDFIELYPLCSTIKNVTINFIFGKLGITKITNRTIVHCQDVFENLENVHFVGSPSNLLYSVLPFSLLYKAKLNALKFSVSECNYVCTTDLPRNHSIDADCKPNYFNISLLNWRDSNMYYQNISSLPALSKFNLETYEFIVIIMMRIDKFTVHTSPLFLDFFQSYFNINADCTNIFQKPLYGNVSIMMWKKETNKFNTVFYDKLFNEVKEYFPKYCLPGTCAPNYDWFYIVPQDENLEVNSVQKHELAFRKKRLGAPNLNLNYDDIFKDKQKIQLSLLFHDHIRSTITLNVEHNYLNKLTYLSLTGSVRYNSDFFNILFRFCCNLITLNVDAPSVFPCASPISRALPLNKSLRNFRLVDRGIDFKVLFISLSRCVTLENIYLTEDSLCTHSDVGDPSIIVEKCKKLYNIYIEAPMSDSVKTKNLQLIKKTKERLKMYALNVALHANCLNNRFRYWYDPFIDVFKLNPIKPIP